MQLINAVNCWKLLSKSLGKKRREISREDMRTITELYANFEETKDCKICEAHEFLYREYSVYQPLQRNYALTKERIEKTLSDGVLDTVYNPVLQEELEEKDMRTAPEEEKLERLLKFAKPLYDRIVTMLEEAASDKIYKKKSDFLAVFTPLFDTLPGAWQNMKEAKKQELREKIAFGLSEMDKTAEIQKDKQGNVIYDSTPEYKEPEKAAVLLRRFMEMEKSVADKIKELGGEEWHITSGIRNNFLNLSKNHTQ